MDSDHQPLRVIIVSGLSGAGKTVALRALEDMGYFCIDNLPVVLIAPFLSTVRSANNITRIGIGVDIREKEFLSDAYSILSVLKEQFRVEVLFLEADMDVMVRRYKETRRPHPMLSVQPGMSMEKAIEQERGLLSVIRDAADKIIDTSGYSPHQLRHFITSTYGGAEAAKGLGVSIISFGFKFGVPQNLDLLFDVRFLPNPYFIPELKDSKGTDTVVSDFVLKQGETTEFLDRLFALIDFLIPFYIKEGRTYLVVGIGCTGGRHRSPAIVEEVSKHIGEKHDLRPVVIHRDME